MKFAEQLEFDFSECFDSVELNINKKIRLITTFSGIGSQEMAFERLSKSFPIDWEIYKAVEFDKYAIASYNSIHKTNFPVMDITKVHAEDFEIKDKNKYFYMFFYSFPCTDLSVAGKQAGMGRNSHTRSGLLWEVERILKEMDSNLPDILIMENVTQVHGKKAKEDFDDWCNFLKSKGYSNFYSDMNSKFYGVAQNRDRCFMVSILGDHNFEFPEPMELNRCMADYLEPEVDEKFYINNQKAKDLIMDLKVRGILAEIEQRTENREQRTENYYNLK